MSGWNLVNFFNGSQQTGNLGAQTPTTPWVGIDGSAQFTAPQRLRDVVGKLKVSQSQNIYDADFEYGVQPLRWEQFISNVSGQAYIVQNPGLGGVSMNIGGGNSPGDITIRQSRPYHRYQPGKTMYMASNVNFGSSVTGQTQRVGIFDDSNGMFFMQTGAPYANNTGSMYAVIRSDSGGLPQDTIMPLDTWNGNQALIQSIDWTKVQMIWMEYAWYGAGALRWGIVINGEPWVLHQVGTGNGIVNGTAQIKPWSRTGNLPVRYEQRDNGSSSQSLMTHYGVSVLIEGGRDPQRGFTYSYGNDAVTQTRTVPASAKRFPALSFRMRAMGTDIFDQTNAACTGGSAQTLTISAATPAISSVVGQASGGNSLVTFASAHGYAVTNPANANNPAQYITLSSFTETATVVTGNYAFSGTTLTVTTAVATGALQAGQTLSGTGVTGSPTIVKQLTATSSAVGSQAYASSGAIGASVVVLAAGTSFAVGQLFAGTGVPAGTFIQAVNGATITLTQTFTAQASGTYTSYAVGGIGTYQVSTSQTTGTGTLTATTTYAAQTWLIQSVPSTTTMVLGIQLANGATLTSTPTATYWGTNQWVGKSVYYQASLPAITAISNPALTTVAGINNYSSTITMGSTVSHNLKVGDVINISGSTPAYMNGQYSVTAVPTAYSATVSWGYFASAPANYTSGASATSPYTGRITSNTTSTITSQDIVTGLPLANGPASGNSYQIGLIDRGQLLPATLLLNSSATCLVELIASTPTNQLSLSQANFVALNTLGSYNSFAEQDLSATTLAGGEVVYAFSTPPNGLQQLDLTNFFAVLTNIKGNVADILTVAVTSSAGATVQVNVVAQEAMA
jgi:hypothetical protein